MYKYKGFTLVEMMVTVAIVSILAAIAYPSYTEYARKARRTDAYEAVQQVAAAQERFYATRRQYASFADPFNNVATLPSPDGYYTVSVVADNVARTFDVTATIAAGNAQAGDTKCLTFSLSSNGRKSSTGTYNDQGDGLQCWR